MAQKMRVYISPSWTVYKYEDVIDVPEGWDNWTQQARDEYVDEILLQEVSDRGYEIVEAKK
jgi:hypothetical protein